jgi:hypothetical protein
MLSALNETTSAEAAAIINFQSTDKNALIVQGIIKTNETQKQHYIKVRSRWSSAEKITITSLTVLTTLMGIVGIILPIAGVNNDVLNYCLGGLSTFLGISAAVFQNRFKTRKRVFSLKIALYNKKIDQAYILWKKAISDGIITEDELTLFNTINNQTTLTAEEENQELAAVKDESGIDNPIVMMIEELKGVLIDNIDKVKDASATLNKA